MSEAHQRKSWSFEIIESHWVEFGGELKETFEKSKRICLEVFKILPVEKLSVTIIH